MAVTDFFAAARALAAYPRVALVDLTEFDPSLDPSDLSALTAARWVAEILAGFSARPGP
jgi:arginase family enzyme